MKPQSTARRDDGLVLGVVVRVGGEGGACVQSNVRVGVIEQMACV